MQDKIFGNALQYGQQMHKWDVDLTRTGLNLIKLVGPYLPKYTKKFYKIGFITTSDESLFMTSCQVNDVIHINAFSP